jgi:manganese efflux pump family protein
MPPPIFINLKFALLILSLGVDTFAVAIGLGVSGAGQKNRLRTGLSFAMFEGIMPILGFLFGKAIHGILGDIASIFGIVALFIVGTWIMKESLSNENKKLEIDSWTGLLLTSFSVSLDELAVGFSIGALGFPIALTAILVAIQAFLFTLIGTTLGNRIGEKLAERAELIAGSVLCLLAISLALEKILRVII